MLDTAGLTRGEQGKTLISLVVTSVGVGLAATVVGIPAVMTPLAEGVSEATGMSLGCRIDDAGRGLFDRNPSLSAAAASHRCPDNRIGARSCLAILSPSGDDYDGRLVAS